MFIHFHCYQFKCHLQNSKLILVKYSKDSIISTVSIKRTVLRFSLMTLLNVPYDLDMAFLRFYCTVSIKRTVWVMPLLYILFACFKSIIFILSDKYKPNI